MSTHQQGLLFLRSIGCGVWIMPFLMLALGGCSKLVHLPIAGAPAKVELQLQVSPASTPGMYEVTGDANLPNDSQLQVMAVRFLHPANQSSRDLNPKPTYAILAYQTVEVNQNKWQATLNLWKPASDGKYQESWQFEQSKLSLPLDADSGVTFLATYAVDDHSKSSLKIDQQLKEQEKILENGVLLTTVDNRRYVQSLKKLNVPLPQGRTTPPPLKIEDINGGWGKRYLMPGEPPNTIKLEFPEKRRTDALPSPKEFMQ